ncbi:hypothetical protein [Flavivirga sp. 57AJ16]|uniref:hypothetical protein n=1 Tax=Flavivirga sp. 57AJ16 TaxID=3025307 RepID=UPI002365EF5D|nr:hypothetical protein [Flavivirga sp. 57AJ16]MDD7885418.1 hypothetical protein [Flavivirga sp. 57AJ16]
MNAKNAHRIILINLHIYSYGVPANIDLFIKLLKHESEENALGSAGECQMFEDVVKKEMLFEHGQKKTSSQIASLEDKLVNGKRT